MAKSKVILLDWWNSDRDIAEAQPETKDVVRMILDEAVEKEVCPDNYYHND